MSYELPCGSVISYGHGHNILYNIRAQAGEHNNIPAVKCSAEARAQNILQGKALCNGKFEIIMPKKHRAELTFAVKCFYDLP